MKKTGFALALTLAVLNSASAFADQPSAWGLYLQTPATDMMKSITWFNEYTLYFIVPITIFVAGLLAYVGWRFSEKNNPVPSKTSHNTMIEVVWTVGPVLVLLFMAVPSFQLLTAQLAPKEEAAMTIKATGNQWYWSYEYQEAEPISFDSLPLKGDDRPEGSSERAGAGKEDLLLYPRLLAVDNEMVVPVNTVVRVIATGADVIHAFAMPAFGIKIDAIPGRLNETWFKANKEGLFYGQCSEICGKDHSFMPIAIRVVTKAKYDTWLVQAKADLPGANKALLAAIAAEKNTNVAAN